MWPFLAALIAIGQWALAAANDFGTLFVLCACVCTFVAFMALTDD